MMVCPFKDWSRYAAVIPGPVEAVKAVAERKPMESATTIPLSGSHLQTPGEHQKLVIKLKV